MKSRIGSKTTLANYLRSELGETRIYVRNIRD